METEERKEKIKEDICVLLREGMYKKDAARLAGVSEDTYLRWYKEDADFADKVEVNIVSYKRSLIRKVTVCAETNGKLALEILRIRWPQEWNMPQKIQYEETISTTTKEVAELLQKILHEGNEVRAQEGEAVEQLKS